MTESEDRNIPIVTEITRQDDGSTDSDEAVEAIPSLVIDMSELRQQLERQVEMEMRHRVDDVEAALPVEHTEVRAMRVQPETNAGAEERRKKYVSLVFLVLFFIVLGLVIALVNVVGDNRECPQCRLPDYCPTCPTCPSPADQEEQSDHLTWSPVNIGDVVKYDYCVHPLVSLSRDGSVFAVSDQGSSWVGIYRLVEDTLTAETEIDAEQGIQSTSLSSDGTSLAIGITRGGSTAVVRVYRSIEGHWSQLGNEMVMERNAQVLDLVPVSLSGNGTVVAWSNPGYEFDSGRVRVHGFNGSMWSQIGRDITIEERGARFGESISLSEDSSILAIGSPRKDGVDDDTGMVRMYALDGNEWKQFGSDLIGLREKEYFGASVSISSSGDAVHVAVGGPAFDNSGLPGQVRVYEMDPSGNFTQLGNELYGLSTHENFGKAVSLSANGVVAIGGGDQGEHVKVYALALGTYWVKLGSSIIGTDAAVSLSEDGMAMVIGARESATGECWVRLYRLQVT